MAKIATLHETKDIESVVEHYLDYPYPLRDPEDDKRRMLIIHGESLNELNHYLYKGKENFKNKFRILVAGGGTGDCSTYMAEQLRDKNGEVVYLDFSKNSLEIAKQRVKNRGLKNVKFINDSIFNIPKLKLGKFDYINCSGVLHHLSSPQEGLQILQKSLKPSGGMCIMVYAKYGRTAVYQIQDLMRMINDGVVSRGQEVENAKKILSKLPATNWYMRSQDLIQDVQNYGDIGIYDLFLHKQDRCYSIPELYEFVESSGLHLVDFAEVRPRLTLKIENYIQDPELLSRIKNTSLMNQQAIAEIISGSVIKHTIYVSNTKNSTASFDDLGNIPFYNEVIGVSEKICEYLVASNHPIGQTMNFNLKKQWFPEGLSISIRISKFTYALFNSLGAGGKKTLKEIMEDIQNASPDSAPDEIKIYITDILKMLIDTGIVLMQHKSVVLKQ